MSSFDTFKLPNELARALHAMEFKTPTPIQEKAIPIGLTGQDLIATAQTGTGKTAAFCLPAATYLLEEPTAVTLVLVPTRELAQQIDLFWRELTKFSPDLRAVCVIGGLSFSMQAKGLAKKPRFIIATPGRLLDHLEQRTTSLDDVGILVLDEADRMLDMGFAPQLNKIVRYLPPRRQTLLFSATWDANLDKLSHKYMYEPVRISAGTTSQAAGTIDQAIINTTTQKKNDTLLDELNRRDGSVLIFARTQHRTDRLTKYLNSYGVVVGRIHGGRSQAQRNAALAGFRAGDIRVLVATDIASRGIDVVDIAHVINYDLPQVPEDYIHRIGRTGRNGSTGQALSILTPEDRALWNDITRHLKKTGSLVPRTDAAFVPTPESEAAKMAAAAQSKLATPPRKSHDGAQANNSQPSRGRRRFRHSRSRQPSEQRG